MTAENEFFREQVGCDLKIFALPYKVTHAFHKFSTKAIPIFSTIG